MPGSPEYSKPDQEWRAPPRPQPEQQANPFALLSRHQRGEEEPSHEELVGSIRQTLAAYIEWMKPHDKFGPVDAMREVFVIAHGRLARAEYPELSGKPCWEYPHAQLAMAWCVISQPYYKLAHVRRNSAIDLQNYEEHLGNTITLDANEGGLLSAMAEAVGIPNPFGPKTPEKQEPR